MLPDAFANWHCDVVALDLHRAFWEKATILHAEHHGPADKPTPDRFARHYADTAALALHAEASGAITQSELRDRVIRWKSRFFGSAWARYDLALPPTFNLVPPPEHEAAIRRDYQAMRDMCQSRSHLSGFSRRWLTSSSRPTVGKEEADRSQQGQRRVIASTVLV